MLTAFAIIASVAAAGSFLFAGLQSRTLSEQTRLANAVAGTATLRDAVQHLDETIGILIDYPALRACFYENAPPPVDPDGRARALLIAEMLADALDSSLHIAEQLPSFGALNKQDWQATAQSYAASSPIFRHTVHTATWWRDLHVALAGPFLDRSTCAICVAEAGP